MAASLISGDKLQRQASPLTGIVAITTPYDLQVDNPEIFF
jgi:hypothetical protein